MSRWTDAFETHPIHTTLNELKDLVGTAFNDVENEEYIERRRFLKFLDVFSDVLAGVDPELIILNKLNTLNEGLNAPTVLGQLRQYQDNGNIQHLISANDGTNNYLPLLYDFMTISKGLKTTKPLKRIEKQVDAFSQIIVEKKDSLSETIKTLADRVVEIEKNVRATQSQIDLQKQQTESQVSQWQQQFSEAQERRNTDYTEWRQKLSDRLNEEVTKSTESITALKQQTESQISQWQQQFSEAQERRNTDYTEWRQKFGDNASAELKKSIDSNNATLAANLEKFQNQIDAIINDGNIKHQRILELYQLVATDSVGGGYLKNADEEKAIADNWRKYSIYFLLGILALLCINRLMWGILPPETFWSPSFWLGIVSTISITAICLWGAAYSAHQSTRHRNNEKKARWFALEVKAIDPFISSLTQEQQNALKRDLSARLFGNLHSSIMMDKDHTVRDEHLPSSVVKLLA